MSRDKYIVLITSYYPYGGASANLLRYLTLCLSIENNNIEVLIPTGSYYGNKLDCDAKRIGFIESVKYRYLGFIYHPKNLIGKLFDFFLGFILPIFYLLLRSLQNKLDIIIIYNPRMISTISYLITKFLLRKKLIIILPEFYEKPKSNSTSLSLIKWYSFIISTKYLIQYADKFIVLTTYLKQFLNNRFRSPKDILIMPNLTDPRRFDINNVKPYMPECTTIGYVGTPTRKDGVWDLIKSFGILHKKYPKTHLLIIGDITNGNTIIPELEKYASESGLNDNSLTFTGLQSYNSIPQLLLSCQILALTRPNGIFASAGFPTKLGEYFSCKKPVLITKVGDIPNYFMNEEHAILVEPENIDSIVSGFEAIINNKSLSDKLGHNGYKWMDENLNYVNQSRRISDFITKESAIILK
jgi:glycosyltransferase involved in cell wall biosynthesis